MGGQEDGKQDKLSNSALSTTDLAVLALKLSSHGTVIHGLAHSRRKAAAFPELSAQAKIGSSSSGLINWDLVSHQRSNINLQPWQELP